MTSLITATDAHFSWLLGESDAVALTQPPGGVDELGVLGVLRRMTASLHAAGCPASWLIASGGEVVGLCSLKRPPDEGGRAEIGYGVAPSRRGRGHATRAVSLLIAAVAERGWASSLSAETAISNLASQRVLSANGFAAVRRRVDREDGELLVWMRPVP